MVVNANQIQNNNWEKIKETKRLQLRGLIRVGMTIFPSNGTYF